MQLASDTFGPVTVYRRAAGAYSGGRWVPGVEAPVTITACVQPGGMKEMMSLEEGDRTKDQLAIWTRDPLYTMNEFTGATADRVLWEGSYWQVRRVEYYGITPEMKHYHAVAIREQA